jgi:hypothetical protein
MNLTGTTKLRFRARRASWNRKVAVAGWCNYKGGHKRNCISSGVSHAGISADCVFIHCATSGDHTVSANRRTQLAE